MTNRALDIQSLTLLSERSAAWRLLSAHHAPFIISFLHRVFIIEQHRQIREHDLLRRLDDHLFQANASSADPTYRRTAKQYVDEWASDTHAWIRATYPSGSDEPAYDITAAARRALEWVASLEDRSFVGTESRLLTVIELLRQIRSGAETDVTIRLRDLERQRDDLAGEIQRVREGKVEPMNDAVIRDRFQLAASNATSLLSDLAEVEQNFRKLDRETRTKIAEWDGSKGTLLDEIFRHRNAISDTDQGRSFRAFYEFLMSPRRKEELDDLLQTVITLPALTGCVDDLLPRIRHEWWRAADQAQRTIARLSEQLRFFLVERSALENRRIAQLMREIERHAAAIRDQPPTGSMMEIDEAAPTLSLPLDRPLFTPPIATNFSDAPVEVGIADVDTAPLFNQVYIDPQVLTAHVLNLLAHAEAVGLPMVIAEHPLTHGVAELVGYLRLATAPNDRLRGFIREDAHDLITWVDPVHGPRRARVPRVIFHH